MWITKIKINNYKSYLDTPEVELSKGINIVVGQNSAGKTALLEVIAGNIKYNGFLNIETKPRTSSQKNEDYRFKDAAEVEIDVNVETLQMLVADHNKTNKVYLRDSLLGFFDMKSEEEFFWTTGYFDEKSSRITRKHINVDTLIKEIDNKLRAGVHLGLSIPERRTDIKGIYDQYEKLSGNKDLISLSLFPDMEADYFWGDYANIIKMPSDNELSEIIKKEFLENRIYKFDIHRTVRAKGKNEKNRQLLPDCSNLADVLSNLQADPTKFKEFKNTFKSIFPNIKDISIDNDAGIPEIRIWLPQSERLDLTISLDECGTGIGQVMAMLYVIIQSDEPKVIIIDEPNSFLHPSASRKLMGIIKQYEQHQYIISTHSPELITSAEADNILLLTLNEEGQTQIKRIDMDAKEDMQEVLLEVGSKLSDVFGYEQVLWVEGPTEEVCLKLIVEKRLKKATATKPILKVNDTGSFEKKHIEATVTLYERLVNGNALIPPALAFIFDKENRSEKDINDLERRGKRLGEKGKIQFLKRRMYENYLLHASAIAAILNHYSDKYGWEKEFSPQEIEAFFEANKQKKEYWDNKKPKQSQLENWKSEIHAAKLLHDLFIEFSESKLEYRKTVHSKELTEWLIENTPAELHELEEMLRGAYQ